VIVYGAIDPVPMIKEKLAKLIEFIHLLNKQSFKRPALKPVLIHKLVITRTLIKMGFYRAGLMRLTKYILPKIDGCSEFNSPDKNDWITNCEAQKQCYWSSHEIMVFFNIL
jgi:hypothetical protein